MDDTDHVWEVMDVMDQKETVQLLFHREGGTPTRLCVFMWINSVKVIRESLPQWYVTKWPGSDPGTLNNNAMIHVDLNFFEMQPIERV